MATNEPSFDLGALESIARRALTVSSDIEVVFRALPDLLQAARRDAEWLRVYALVWSIIHGERVDAPLPPLGPRGLVSAAAEFSAMRAAMSEARAAQAEAERKVATVLGVIDAEVETARECAAHAAVLALGAVRRRLTMSGGPDAASQSLNPPETTT